MMHTMNQDLSKLCYYFYLRMKLESTVLVLRILMIITILHSIEYRNVLLHNGAGNFLLDTNYILKVYVVDLLGTTTHFWKHD